MDDPQRLLSAQSDADELERELLSGLRGTGPSAREKAAMFAGLSAELLALGVGVAASAAPPGTAQAAVELGARATTLSGGIVTGKAVTGKVVALLVMGGLTLGGSSMLFARRAHKPQPSAQHSKVEVAPSHAVEAPRVAEPPQADEAPDAQANEAERPEVAIERARVRERRSVPKSVKPSAQLLAQSRLLTAARAALKRGDAPEARRLLLQLGAHHAGTPLDQEREVLHIEVLAAEAQGDAVKRHVRAFLEAHPDSPHSARLARYLDAP